MKRRRMQACARGMEALRRASGAVRAPCANLVDDALAVPCITPGLDSGPERAEVVCSRMHLHMRDLCVLRQCVRVRNTGGRCASVS